MTTVIFIYLFIFLRATEDEGKILTLFFLLFDDVRYVKNVPAHQSFNLMPYVQKFQQPYLFSQPSQMAGMQAAVNYRNPFMTPFCAPVLNQTSRDGVYLQWPSQSMMYAHSYDQLRHTVFQVGYLKYSCWWFTIIFANHDMNCTRIYYLEFLRVVRESLIINETHFRSAQFL